MDETSQKLTTIADVPLNPAYIKPPEPIEPAPLEAPEKPVEAAVPPKPEEKPAAPVVPSHLERLKNFGSPVTQAEFLSFMQTQGIDTNIWPFAPMPTNTKFEDLPQPVQERILERDNDPLLFEHKYIRPMRLADEYLQTQYRETNAKVSAKLEKDISEFTDKDTAAKKFFDALVSDGRSREDALKILKMQGTLSAGQPSVEPKVPLVKGSQPVKMEKTDTISAWGRRREDEKVWDDVMDSIFRG